MSSGLGVDDGRRPPPPPPGAPSDWAAVVHRTAWSDIERLGIWTGGGTPIPVGHSPSGCFGAVAPRTLGGGATPAPIYVVVHGWAPGLRSVVDQAGGRVQWGSATAHVDGRWPSDWCWAPVVSPRTASRPAVVIDPTGVVQQINRFDEDATILAYSWIDDSATDSGILNLEEVYASEAYTHLNGIRLANALLDAIVPSFFANGGQVHLLGHSHGSRVSTVAAMTLQERGLPATHLSILDSPEDEMPLEANGANLLGFYLEQLEIRDPASETVGGLYVDSYASCYGVAYDSAAAGSPVRNVVDVALSPTHLYGELDFGDRHTYAPAWYGGAADGAARAHRPPVGLGWPPVPHPHTPAMNQEWGGPGEDQWTLTPGPSLARTYRYATFPLDVEMVDTQGGVTVGDGEILFRPAGIGTPWSVYRGRYGAQHLDQYGIAFDLEWALPDPEELFVVGVGDDGWDASTLLVLDGRSIPPGATTSIAINTVVWGLEASITMYFLGDPTTRDLVRVSHLRYVEVSSADGRSPTARQPGWLEAGRRPDWDRRSGRSAT